MYRYTAKTGLGSLTFHLRTLSAVSKAPILPTLPPTATLRPNIKISNISSNIFSARYLHSSPTDAVSRVIMSKAFVQKPAPAFTATTVLEHGEFKEVSLSDYKGKWVVLLFYPMDFTFVCPTEILAFNDALPRFEKLNTAVLGVSTDSHFTHLAWRERPRKQGGLGDDLRLPLVADKSFAISRDYGVLIEDAGIALRGLFLIDPRGTLRQITVNDLPVGRNVEETLRLVEAFQYTDEHGEVCPAGWQPGGETMKADPKGSLEYFGKQGGQ